MLQKRLKELHGSVIDLFAWSRVVSCDINPFFVSLMASTWLEGGSGSAWL